MARNKVICLLMGWTFILCTEKPESSVWSELLPKKLMPAAESKELVVWSGIESVALVVWIEPMTSKLLPEEVKEEWKDKIYVHLWHAVENMAWVMWCGQRTLVGVKVVVGLPKDVILRVVFGSLFLCGIVAALLRRKLGSMKKREPDWETTWETLLKEKPPDTSSAFVYKKKKEKIYKHNNLKSMAKLLLTDLMSCASCHVSRR